MSLVTAALEKLDAERAMLYARNNPPPPPPPAHQPSGGGGSGTAQHTCQEPIALPFARTGN